MRLLYLLALALVGWVQLPVQLLAQTYDSNFYNCNHGLSYGCDSSKLTSDQKVQVEKSALSRNFYSCNHGYSCDSSKLTNDEKIQVEKSALSRNFYNCNHGYSCDSSKLTNEQQAKISKGSSERVSAPIGCAENGSCYGDISSITGRPKTISVGGYYRRDGTYVRGHYRSRR